MRAIGIDPDTHRTGLALVDEGRLVGAGVIRTPKELTGAPAVAEMIRRLLFDLPDWLDLCGVRADEPVVAAVEGQRLVAAAGRRHARPEDLLRLAQVTGGAMASVQGSLDRARLLVPKPQEWKGQVPKQVHQARTLRALGLDPVKHGSGASGYCRPSVEPSPLLGSQGAFSVRGSDWKHVCDAVGLALWAAKRVIIVTVAPAFLAGQILPTVSA